MKERSKLKSFFLGDIDDYGIALIGLFILTMASPALARSIAINIAPVSITAYFVCYTLRFKQKQEVGTWDKFKLAFTFLVFLTTLEFYLLRQLGALPIVVGNAVWLLLYFFDRMLLRAAGKLMYLGTIIIVLISLFFTVFAQLKTEEHYRQKSLSDALNVDADKLQKIAELEAANTLEAEARVRQLEAELKNCQQTTTQP